MSDKLKELKKNEILDEARDKDAFAIRRVCDPGDVKYKDTFFNMEIGKKVEMLKMSDILLGSEVSQRAGNRICVVGYTLSLVASSSVNWCALRVAMIRWMLDTGIHEPTGEDLYQNLEESGINSFYNYDNRNDFTILEKVSALLMNDSQGNATHVLTAERKKKKCDIPIYYLRQDDTGIGHIYIAVYGSEEQCANLRVNCRLYYYDL